MKKSLLVLFGVLLIFQGSMSYGATSEGPGIFSTLKNSIIKDVESTVQSTVQSTVTTAATKALNTVKLAQKKQELAQKKQELADLEASNKNFIAKFFQRRKINREIRDIEKEIKGLES